VYKIDVVMIIFSIEMRSIESEVNAAQC